MKNEVESTCLRYLTFVILILGDDVILDGLAGKIEKLESSKN
jgi:hypothetical protein